MNALAYPTDLREILEIPECFCGRAKKIQQPFCGHCFYSLPQSARTFVKYIRNGNYRGTYEAAREWLERHTNDTQTPRQPLHQH